MTLKEQAEAAKLYALLYRGDNIYNAPRGRQKNNEDALHRFVGIVKEFKQYLKANENGK